MFRNRELGEGLLLALFLFIVTAAVFLVVSGETPAAKTVTPVHEVDIRVTEAPRVNINTATVEELTELAGIGEAIAERIVEKRGEIGGYKQIEDLLEIQGIGEAKLNEIRESICIG